MNNTNRRDFKAIKRILWAVVLLSLIPALFLAAKRIGVEGSSRTVTLLLDEPALAEQANYLGQSSFELAKRYQALGLNGIALYEETLESLETKGKIAMLTGQEARSLALSRGEDQNVIPANSTLVSELVPGALSDFLAKNSPQPQELSFLEQNWYLYPGLGNIRPAGPNREFIKNWADAGYDIAYRPRNFPNLVNVGQDFPAEASYLIYAGTEVSGQPNNLESTAAASQPYITGLIEGTEQDGMLEIVRQIPSARVFGINQDWLNTLKPEVVVDKFLLAANERGARLLYVRPYTKEKVGDMVSNTEALISGLRRSLEADGFSIGPVRQLEYETNTLLRFLSVAGILAGLGLLALMYPGAWGPIVALAVLGLGIVAGGGLNWDALALAAALSFPVIGYGLLPEKLHSLGLATLISLAGAVLLAAVGSDREAMLAATPFAGVAATLIVPPLLYLFHYALRFRRPVQWVVDFWNYPVRIGDVALVFIGILALAVVFLRRGNFPVIGVSGTEIALRDWLSGIFVRPRFKELLGHPLAVLALTNGRWPDWLRGLLLTGGVIAQASILNSFSHYHSPLLISLQRSLIALLLGFLIGLVLSPIARLLTRLIARWLASAQTFKTS